MKISKKIQTALNKQINAELYSAYLYLAMAAYFDKNNLAGFAQWMKKQAKEETEHALKFYQFIFARAGEVVLKAIERPTLNWKSPLAVFENVYSHEQKVTQMINVLVDLVEKEKDKATAVFLHWFVNEQVEEETSALEIVEKLKVIKNNSNGLLMLNEKLGQRK